VDVSALLPLRRRSTWDAVQAFLGRGLLLVAAANQRVHPSGWLERSKIETCRIYEYLLSLVERERRVISPAAVEVSDITLARQRGLPQHISLEALQPRAGCARKCALGQAYLDLARVACALERFRLVNNHYPETLDALAPRFIATMPRDVVSGQPLHYRCTPDDRFVLYSIGWNLLDDHGTPGLRKSGSVDETAGDWVWRYPEK
jgi:hypothetical protein